MRTPFQCLEKCGKVLIAARGSTLDTFSLRDGSQISSWTCPVSTSPKSTNDGPSGKETPRVDTLQSEISSAEITVDPSPPVKRRKLSNDGHEEQATNGKAEKTKKPKTISKLQDSENPAFIALVSTKDAAHVIAVTGEDKSIRVFKHDQNGNLDQISQRVMPKRPSAIVLSTDQKTIICADKFGDVYSLPLIFTERVKHPEPKAIAAKSASPAPVEENTFVSAATTLTVHTKQNLRSLENQLKQKQKHVQVEKNEPSFDYTLLLGHVSMLTDIAVVEHQKCNYIVTADRDEHIRISRGIPQTHVIEGFCLGHEDFVSRLCFPNSHPNLLVSGGGDDNLFVWDWLSGRLLQKVDLGSQAEEVMESIVSEAELAARKEANDGRLKIAVSNIKYMGGEKVGNRNFLIVTCEGIPCLFIYTVDETGKIEPYRREVLHSNPLAIAIEDSTGGLYTSFDFLHKRGSTDTLRDDSDTNVPELLAWDYHDSLGTWGPGHVQFKYKTEEDSSKNVDDQPPPNISGVLYNLENLRKRGGEE